MLNGIWSKLGPIIQNAAMKETPGKNQVVRGYVSERPQGTKTVVEVGGRSFSIHTQSNVKEGRTYFFKVLETEPVMKWEALREGRHAAMPARTGGRQPLSTDKAMLDTLPVFPQPHTAPFLPLLQSDRNSAEFIQVMARSGLTVPPALINSLVRKASHSVTATFAKLEQALSQAPISRRINKLQGVLTHFTAENSSESAAGSAAAKLLREVAEGDRSSYQLFRQIGLISTQSFSSYRSAWLQWAENGEESPPFPQSLEKMAEKLKGVWDVVQSRELVDPPTIMKTSLSHKAPLLPFATTLEKGMIEDTASPPGFSSPAVDKVWPDLLSRLHHIRNDPAMIDLLVDWVSRLSIFLKLSEKEHAYIRLKAAVASYGFDSEKRMVSGEPQRDSLKSLLLHPESKALLAPQVLKETLNTLNKMQSISRRETDQGVQLFLQLPGAVFHASGDIYITMDGKKKRNSSALDPSFCHILFYLNLESLDETVLDLRINNKNVSVLVEPGAKGAGALVESYKKELEQGLSEQGYRLVKFHVYDSKETCAPKTTATDKKGVDVWI